MISRTLGRATLLLAATLLITPLIRAQTPEQAQQLQSQGDWKGAEAVWRQLLRQNSGDYRIWASLGIALSHQQRYPDAVAAYGKALALQPNDRQTELNLGIAYFKMGRLAEAVKPLQIAATSPDNAPQCDVLLGISLYGIARYRQALPHLQRACALEPHNVELRRALGQAYLHAGEYDNAMGAFKEVLTQSPDSPQAHMLLGEAYDAGNREEAAIAEFRAATEGPYLPNAYFSLGYLFWKAHNYDGAAVAFQQELDHDPKNSQALAYLGDVVLKRGDSERAAALLRRSVGLRDDDHLAFVDLGTIETADRQYALAEKHLDHAVRLNPHEADGHYRLARLYQATARSAQAAREFALVKQLHEHDTNQMVFKVTHRDQTIPATPAH